MSIASSLLLFLLLFYFHACDARRFGVLPNEIAKEFHHSVSKENMKSNPARVSKESNRKEYHSIPNEHPRDVAKEESNRLKEGNSEPHKMRNRIEVSRSEDVASSWRVPDHKKGGEPEPGFNLDYLPPKTHPPVHN